MKFALQMELIPSRGNCALRIRQQGFVLMYCSASSTQQPPILPHQPSLDLSLGAGASGPCRDFGHTEMLHSWCPCSLLLPYPGESFSAAAASATPRCHHSRFLCKNGCWVCSWLLLTTCMEHACPAVGKASCYQQVGEMVEGDWVWSECQHQHCQTKHCLHPCSDN